MVLFTDYTLLHLSGLLVLQQFHLVQLTVNFTGKFCFLPGPKFLLIGRLWDVVLFDPISINVILSIFLYLFCNSIFYFKSFIFTKAINENDLNSYFTDIKFSLIFGNINYSRFLQVCFFSLPLSLFPPVSFYVCLGL